jgi:predicted lipid-binding transport protein (Tim44 family)
MAVVLAMIGALLGMLIMGQPFSIIMSGTGMLALAGIVVNHNIVLIDTFTVAQGGHGSDRGRHSLERATAAPGVPDDRDRHRRPVADDARHRDQFLDAQVTIGGPMA